MARTAGAARPIAVAAATRTALAVASRATVAAAALTARAAAVAAGPTAGADGRELLDRLAGDLGVVGEAQADAAALAVDLDHADRDLVALVEHLLDGADAVARRHVGDVQQAVGALGELDERAEGRRLDDLAAEELVADLDLLGHRADALGQRLALARRWRRRRGPGRRR